MKKKLLVTMLCASMMCQQMIVPVYAAENADVVQEIETVSEDASAEETTTGEAETDETVTDETTTDETLAEDTTNENTTDETLAEDTTEEKTTEDSVEASTQETTDTEAAAEKEKKADDSSDSIKETKEQKETDKESETDSETIEDETSDEDAEADALENNYIEIPEEAETPSIGDCSMYANVPRKYDNRSQLPSIRNQNPYGACWAFASMGMGDIQLNTDLSELHLAYFTYHTSIDPLGGTAGDSNELQSGKDFMTIGGSTNWAANTLMSWKGAVNESTLPYGNTESVRQNGLDAKKAYTNNSAHLLNEYRINIKSDAQMVKNAIMERGSVATSYYTASKYFNSKNNAYYCDTPYKSNHAILLVGWDDDFSRNNFKTKPSKNGAWLVRNSWGGKGESYYAYFWMSYEDASLIGTAYSFDYTPAGASNYYDNNYQYDGVVMSNVYRDEGTGYIGGANIFTANASASEILKAVSFATEGVNSKCTISIYKNLKNPNNPQSGDLVSKQDEYTKFSGIYTFPLKKEVSLNKGEKYSVVVTLEGSNQSIEVETGSYSDSFYKFNSTCKKGQSFLTVGRGGTWWDLADQDNVGNIRIKAYTNNTKSTASSNVNINTAETKQNIKDQTIKLAQTSCVYNGKAQTPAVTVTNKSGKALKKDTDYTVAYKNNVNVGTATAVVTGKGSYQGTVECKFKIVKTHELVDYKTQIQKYGWEKTWKKDGELSGTVGEAKRLEAIEVTLDHQDYSGNIEYRTQIQKYGWEKTWKKNGGLSGTVGEAKRLEAIQIRLTGEMAKKYDVYYRVQAQKLGWMGWAKNGASAGTAGYAYRLEAIRIVLVPKGEKAPGSTANAFAQKK